MKRKSYTRFFTWHRHGIYAKIDSYNLIWGVFYPGMDAAPNKERYQGPTEERGERNKRVGSGETVLTKQSSALWTLR